MAKVTVTKLFEYARVASTQGGKDLKEFIDFVNQNFEQVVSALVSKLSLKDNFKGEELSLTLTHAKETVANVNGSSVIGVQMMRVVTDGSTLEALTSLAWYITSDNKLALTPYFRTADATKTRDCVLFVYQK